MLNAAAALRSPARRKENPDEEEPRSPHGVDRSRRPPIQGGDPDGDPLTYVVALGTTDPPPYVTTTSLSQYAPALRWGTTYYWRIRAGDGITTTAGPTWRFNTMPAEDVHLPLMMRR